jgi:mRNA-degrading endonuclease RelE of RelBE toxin-antitoxin system
LNGRHRGSFRRPYVETLDSDPALTERFQADVRGLPDLERAAAFDVLMALPKRIGEPHLHAGVGVRKLHASGIWEARCGLGLRLVFTMASDLITFVRIGSHDDVKRYLKSL